MTDRILLAATRNPGKIREFRGLLAGLPFLVRGLADLGIGTEIEESGATFRENAEIKARGYAVLAGEIAVSDDSGLVVDALGGAPGVYSARFAGPDASDADRISKLLAAIEASGSSDRSARFVCAISAAAPDGTILATCEGVCEGTIAREARGGRGFGYDPVFVPAGFDRSFGELSDEVKSQISHRARASAKLLAFFRR
jgi:XTP/dITP diphosphohydrolase